MRQSIDCLHDAQTSTGATGLSNRPGLTPDLPQTPRDLRPSTVRWACAEEGGYRVWITSPLREKVGERGAAAPAFPRPRGSQIPRFRAGENVGVRGSGESVSADLTAPQGRWYITAMPEFVSSPATRPWRGTIRVPADKSISHRAAILATLAHGDTRIENYLQSETTHATLRCLEALGAEIERSAATTVVVHGRGLRSLREPGDVLFCAGSGTTMRLLAGLCAGQDFLSILTGTPALKRRPMARVSEPLRKMGATILGREGGRLPPLAIRGARLHGVDHVLPVASAQVKSALLLAGLFADSETGVCEPSLSRDHTERMLRACGVTIQAETASGLVRIRPPERLEVPPRISVPGDMSSAAFPVVAALLVPGSELRIDAVGVNPTRTGLVDVLQEMGAPVVIENRRDESGEPVADLVVRAGGELQAATVSGPIVPRMIDEFPVFAVAATQARGETVVRDAQELRVKESDRIGTLAAELRKMGAQIDERADGFVISGPVTLIGARVDAHSDHRLAMSLAVAGLIARGETVIQGWECVADSFPDFERLWSSFAQRTVG